MKILKEITKINDMKIENLILTKEKRREIIDGLDESIEIFTKSCDEFKGLCEKKAEDMEKASSHFNDFADNLEG
jgi:hypothetical protein